LSIVCQLQILTPLLKPDAFESFKSPWIILNEGGRRKSIGRGARSRWWEGAKRTRRWTRL